MNPQHVNRRVRAEVSIRRLVQYAVYLAVVLWLLYQIYQSLRIREGYSLDDIKNQLNDERTGQLLGRKGGLGTSNHAGKKDLYGAADKIKHDAKDNDDDEDIPAEDDEEDDDIIAAEEDEDAKRRYDEKIYAEEYLRDHTEEDDDGEDSSKNDDKGLKRRSYGELSAKKGKTRKKVQQKKANNSTGNGGQKLKLVKRRKKGVKVGEKNRTEVGSLVNFGAVILKSVDKNWEVFQFNDENGVPKYESAPSRRSNIQVDSLLKENKLSSGNHSKDLEACQILCLQHVLDKQSLSESEAKAAVHGEIKEATEAESGKESMRELLQKVR